MSVASCVRRTRIDIILILGYSNFYDMSAVRILIFCDVIIETALKF